MTQFIYVSQPRHPLLVPQVTSSSLSPLLTNRGHWFSNTMASTSVMAFDINRYSNEEITDSILKDAAALFSGNYGVWGAKGPKPGARVKMQPQKLRNECLPDGSEIEYVRAMHGESQELAGNVLACSWQSEGRNICWITQLVVNDKYRGQGLATRLLAELRSGHEDRGFGLLSSHPVHFNEFLIHDLIVRYALGKCWKCTDTPADILISGSHSGSTSSFWSGSG